MIRYSKIIINFLRVIIILLLIGVIFPTTVDLLLKIITSNAPDTPKGNSTFVMSYKYFRNSYFYYLDKIISDYFKM